MGLSAHIWAKTIDIWKSQGLNWYMKFNLVFHADEWNQLYSTEKEL